MKSFKIEDPKKPVEILKNLVSHPKIHDTLRNVLILLEIYSEFLMISRDYTEGVVLS